MANPSGFRDPSKTPADWATWNESSRVFESFCTYDGLYFGFWVIMIGGSYWRVILPIRFRSTRGSNSPPALPKKETQNVARIPKSTWVGL
jgi:hypothetical protein